MPVPYLENLVKEEKKVSQGKEVRGGGKRLPVRSSGIKELRDSPFGRKSDKGFVMVDEQQRNNHRPRPVGDGINRKGKPGWEENHFGGKRRNFCPAVLTENGQGDSGEDIDLAGATLGENPLPGSDKRRMGRIKSAQLQRLIGLDGGTDIGVAVVKKWPSAFLSLNGKDRPDNFVPADRIQRSSQDLMEKHIFRGDRRIGLKGRHPVPRTILCSNKPGNSPGQGSRKGIGPFIQLDRRSGLLKKRRSRRGAPLRRRHLFSASKI